MQALRNNEPLPNTPQAQAANSGGGDPGSGSGSNLARRRRVVTSLFMNNGASSGGLTPRKAHGTVADNARPFLTVCEKSQCCVICARIDCCKRPHAVLQFKHQFEKLNLRVHSLQGALERRNGVSFGAHFCGHGRQR